MFKLNIKLISNKKCQVDFSLQTLAEQILSAIALTILFLFFLSFAFNQSSNEKISEENAESIKEFIEFSSTGKYSNLEDCYTQIKLNNLENFQIEKKKDNFFYVLDGNGIYILELKELDFITSKDFDYIFKAKKKIPFENDDKKIDIYIDETKEDDKVLYLNNKIDFLVLFPNLGDNNNDFEFKYFFEEKIDEVENPEDFQIFFLKNIEGDSLVFNQDRNYIFIPTNKFSNSLVNNNLCSIKYLMKKDLSDFYNKNNGKNIDYINYDVEFQILNTESKEILDESFFWSAGPYCFKNKENVNCNVYFDEEIDNNLGYKNFISKIENFINLQISEEYDNVRLNLIVKEKELTLEEVKDNINLVDILHLNYDDFFEDGNNLNLLSQEEIKKENVFQISKPWSFKIFQNEKINGCKEYKCILVQYINSKVSYFIKAEDEKYYYASFKEIFLRKGEYNRDKEVFDLYFNGEKLEFISKVKAKNIGNRNDEFFYWYKIINYDEEVDVILSDIQIDKGIPKVFVGGDENE